MAFAMVTSSSFFTVVIDRTKKIVVVANKQCGGTHLGRRFCGHVSGRRLCHGGIARGRRGTMERAVFGLSVVA